MKLTKKKLLILISICVSVALVLSGVLTWVLIANGDKGDKVNDYKIHQIEGTIHKVNVQESDVPFIKNDATNYKIYLDQSDEKLKTQIVKSANFVVEQILKATGVEISTEEKLPTTLSDKDYAIIYGNRDFFTSVGLTMPTDDISTVGYYIKSKGNLVFIEANGGDGYRMGGLAFLREVIGYDMISEDCVIYGRNPETMPTMDIVERPDFDYRQISNYYTSVEIYGMGMHSHTDIWIPVNGWDMHNTLYYIDPDIYYAEHPEWYRADKQQVCYTAHGVKEEYDAMLHAVFEVVKKRMEELPEIENMSFSAMDGTGIDSCYCENCTIYHSLYGTPASTCIYFMNDLNALVQSYIKQSSNPDRVMNLVFFAYHDAEPAPVERQKYTDANGKETWTDPIANSNGEYQPLRRYKMDAQTRQFVKDASGKYVYETDANGNPVYLTCDEHVYPWLAPIYSKFTKSFYEEENASYANNVSSWQAVASNVYVWIYGTNFKYYLYPYNTWSPVVETYRFLKERGVKYVWNQAQERNMSTAFTDLKDYIDSKFLFDVNADYGKVIDTYFDNYYKEASEPMRNMFELIQAQSAYLEKTIPTISGGIYDDIGSPEFWPRLLLEQLNSYIEQSYKAVEKYKVTDPKLYNDLIKRIKKESIFPRYVICTYYEDSYPNIYELRKAFKNDWVELGFSIYKETDGDMQSVFTSWGV